MEIFFPLEAWCLPDNPKTRHRGGHLFYWNQMWFCSVFPGGPVVKTLCFQCRGRGLDPWSGNYVPHLSENLCVLCGTAKKKKMKKVGLQQDSTVVSKYLFTDY